MKKKLLKYIFPAIGVFLLSLYTITLFAPLLWGIINSFKGRLEFVLDSVGLPEKVGFHNLVLAFKRLYVDIILLAGGSRKVFFGELMFNSLLYAALSSFMLTFTPFAVAYAITKFPFRFGKVLYAVALLTFFLPIIGSLPSELQMVRTLHLYDNFVGLAVLKGHFSGIYFFVFYGALKSMTKEYDEAAKIDGASHLRILLRINLPLMRTTIFAVLLLCFVSCWNEYTTPMLFMPTHPTVSYGLYKFQFSTENDINSTPMQLTACFIASLPILAIYIAFKRYLVGNIAVGGIKG